jgi:Bacterial Ig-like domain (group 3)
MTTFVTNGQANGTGTIQTYTIATSGYYDILSMGAQGGVGIRNAQGGGGAMVEGEVHFTAGTVLNLIVGAQGNSIPAGGGGGGGGTFVYVNNNLIEAAGGGGGGSSYSVGGGFGQSSQIGQRGSGSGGGNGGAIGNGGTGGHYTGGENGGGGAGWTGGGVAGTSLPSGSGGLPFPTWSGGSGGGFGGYGGGGGGLTGGGGGGGYSGGGGGGGGGASLAGGGGGGSYIISTATNQILIPGANTGNGEVDITLVSADVSPTTTTLVASSTQVTTGQVVTLTATESNGGNTIPTGTVTFYDGQTQIGQAVTLDGNGIATLSTSSLAIGAHSITAVYSGDLNDASSTSSADAITVIPPAIATSLSIGNATFINNILSGDPTFTSVAGDSSAVNLISGSAYYGDITNLISISDLVSLSNPSLQAANLQSNGEQVLPEVSLDAAVLASFINPNASALHYEFVSGLSNGASISLSNSATVTPYLTDVAIVNSLSNCTATVDISPLVEL